MVEITEKIIAKAGLSPDEAKVIRAFRQLETAGKRTKNWVEKNISPRQYFQLLKSAVEKIEKFLETKEAGK